MGLLDQILGSVLGRSSAGGGMGGGLGSGLGRGGGMSSVLMALLPVVLGMIANRGAGSGRSPGPGQGPGGLGGLGGGLGGLLEQFTKKGYGDQAQSWIGTGPNQSLPMEALSDVFGDDQLAHIASQAGVSQDEARQGLSQLLPEVVDHFTPQGQLPPVDQLLASIDDYGRQLPR